MSKQDSNRITLHLEDENITMFLDVKKNYGKSKSELKTNEIMLDVFKLLLNELGTIETIADIQYEGDMIYSENYSFILELYDEIIKQPCKLCGKTRTPEGFDACLGYLPGVKYACCGHGKEGCITFENGTRIYGHFRTTKE